MVTLSIEQHERWQVAEIPGHADKCIDTTFTINILQTACHRFLILDVYKQQHC